MKIHNLLFSLFAFLHALASAGELKSTDRFCQLIKVAKHLHARARRAILVSARSERYFEMQSGCFGYCHISLNAAKIIILPVFFYKSGGLTRLWCNLAIFDQITRFISFLLVDDFCRSTFQSLKSNKTTFRWVNTFCTTYYSICKRSFRITLKKK